MFPRDQPLQSQWLSRDDCHLDLFSAIAATETTSTDYPNASRIENSVPVYDARKLLTELDNQSRRREVQSELIAVLLGGPGIAVFEGAFEHHVVDRVSTSFREMILEQRANGVTAGDHFAKAGANDRVWNALEKLAVRDPEAFVDYYANDILAVICSAWLGPGYQVTSQVNVVNPGGPAQSPHRDYHLGFQSDAAAELYPTHVHQLSPLLTLQGAVAHVDMPIDSGPTLYLPHSQKFLPGYLAWRNASFVQFFEEHAVQLPLAKGDAVFFNPALFHAAGTNRTRHIERMANLLQVSSAFARAMETVDRQSMVEAIYPVLLGRRDAAGSSEPLHRSMNNAVASAAEGYPFPTNLDRDQPLDGLAPESQSDLVCEALLNRMSVAEVRRRLDQNSARRM